MLSCKQVAAALDSSEKQSLLMKMRLHAHCLICRDCTNYSAQLQRIKDRSKELLSKLSRFDRNDARKLEEEIIRKLSKDS